MKKLCCIPFLFLCLVATSTAQEVKMPVEKKDGHLLSQWILNGRVEASVFLESGFPKIVFSRSFVEKNRTALNLKLNEASEDTYISLWSGSGKYKVLYTINDSLTINGVKRSVDALVMDFEEVKAWKACDVVFPIADLQQKVELNISEGYMKIWEASHKIPSTFISYEVSKDSATKALYTTTTLRVYDTDGGKEELTGNFQLDLGAANAFIVNKNIPDVVDFISKADRMQLKDTSRFNGPKEMDLAVIMPHKIRLGNVELENSFVVGMKYRESERSNKYAGNIGNSFFEHFVIIFDFENSRFYLKPNSDKVSIVE